MGALRKLLDGEGQVVLLTKYYSSDQIKEHEMGGACIVQGNCVQSFGWKA
jgi:hypothetical protein